MSFEPTPTQALLLFGLLAKHGACRQAELLPTVKAKDREALVGAKLVEAVKAKGMIQLALTDEGWSWAGDHLSTELPPAHGALHDLLARLGDHLARSGETLADFVGSKPQGTLDPDIKRKAPAKIKAPAKRKMPTPAALRRRIEAAYLSITGDRKNQSVKLSALRECLGNLDRATVDAALARIASGDKKASLMRHDDPRQLDAADHQAAFKSAGEPFHVIWIAS